MVRYKININTYLSLRNVKKYQLLILPIYTTILLKKVIFLDGQFLVKKFNTIPFVTFFINGKKVKIFSALTYLNIRITCCNKISLTIFVNFRHHHGKVLQQLVSCSLFFFSLFWSRFITYTNFSLFTKVIINKVAVFFVPYFDQRRCWIGVEKPSPSYLNIKHGVKFFLSSTIS